MKIKKIITIFLFFLFLSIMIEFINTNNFYKKKKFKINNKLFSNKFKMIILKISLIKIIY